MPQLLLKYNLALALNCLQNFPRLFIWSSYDRDLGSKVPWIQLAFDFVSRYGFQPGWLSDEMSVCLLIVDFVFPV